ncbi:MAG: gluconokinase [Burkholderiales bacterium]|nr:gluconokinase [Burkholderiales bacterium]
MPAPRLIVMGVSGCGKSTVGGLLGARTGIPFIEGDTLHPARNVALMAAGTPLTDEDRAGWLDDIASRFGALEADAGLIISCSALKRIYRDRLRAVCPDLRFIHLRGDKALLEQRLQYRIGHYMPPSLLTSQLQTLEPPGSDEPAITLDIAMPTDQLVAHIEQQLHLQIA